MVVDGENSTKAWYREPWLWLILAPLITVVCVSGVMVTIAVTGADDIVVDNYYREGRMLSQDHTADEYAKSIGLEGSLDFRSNDIRLTLNQTSLLQDLTLLLSHPAKADLDQRITLQRVAPGEFRASHNGELHGRWYLRLTADQGDHELWRMHGEIDLSDTTDVTLQ